MTKLEKLYVAIMGLQELGIPLHDETLKAVDVFEELLIKSGNLPAMSKNIGHVSTRFNVD